MEITDGNLHVLAGYLQKTLSPDPVERRGGLMVVVAAVADALRDVCVVSTYLSYISMS